jgi:hypothetical protein
MPTKNRGFSHFFASHQFTKIKSPKEVAKYGSRNQGFTYFLVFKLVNGRNQIRIRTNKVGSISGGPKTYGSYGSTTLVTTR